MTGVVLKAEKREQLGSLVAKKIKRTGKIPAVIYNKDGNINITIDVKEFEFEYFKGNTQATVIELDFDGKKTKVITHNIDLDPVSDRPIHVDFLNCENSKAVKAQPKLNFINQDKSTGLKKGGFLHIVLRRVSVICDSVNNVPTSIDIDVAPMQVGQKVRGSDLNLPAGVTLAKKGTFLVASIIGRASKTEDETAAGAAAGTTPAAGAAAAKAPAAAKSPAAKSDKK
jgi:large subunit ribosomal protein L25